MLLLGYMIIFHKKMKHLRRQHDSPFIFQLSITHIVGICTQSTQANHSRHLTYKTNLDSISCTLNDSKTSSVFTTLHAAECENKVCFLYSARCRPQKQSLFWHSAACRTQKQILFLHSAACGIQKTDFVFILCSVQNLKTDFVFLLCSVQNYHSAFVFIPRKGLASKLIGRFTAILHTGLSLRKSFSHPEEKKAPPTYHAGGAFS